MERARARFAELVNAASDEVAVTKNASEGLNIIAASLPWQAGDNVVIFYAGHGSQMWDESGDEDDGLDETLSDDVRAVRDERKRLRKLYEREGLEALLEALKQ